MKTIVAGSRDYTNYTAVASILRRCPWGITEVVCGEARGADAMGRKWAENNDVKIASFPADWDQYGKAAGYKRNTEMAEYANACVAFWDGKSTGTKHMIDIALEHGLHLLVVMT